MIRRPTRARQGASAPPTSVKQDSIPCGLAGCPTCSAAPVRVPAGATVFVIDSTVLTDAIAWIIDPQNCHIYVPWSAVSAATPQVSDPHQSNIYRRIAESAPTRVTFFRDQNCTATAVPRATSTTAAAHAAAAAAATAAYLTAHAATLPADERPTIVLVGAGDGALSPSEAAAAHCPSSAPSLATLGDRTSYTPHLPAAEARALVEQSDAAAAAGAPVVHVAGLFKARMTTPFAGVVQTPSLDMPVQIVGRWACNRALDGDRVVVEIIKDTPTESTGDNTGAADEDAVADVAAGEVSAKSLNGKIISILERSTRSFVGSLDQAWEEWHQPPRSAPPTFIPFAPALPSFRCLDAPGQRYAGQRLVAGFADWPLTSMSPHCTITGVLGPIGSPAVEASVVLKHCNVRTEPLNTAHYMAELAGLSEAWEPSANDLRWRRDLRDRPVCSIDPPGCMDIDDALHCQVISPDRAEVGIHIADVSAFVLPGGAIDSEARHRCTTNYLSDRRVDMLPTLLTESLCSLVPDRDRLAFTVLFIVDPTRDYKIVEGPTFCRSIIRSKRKYEYSEALRDIENREMVDDVVTSCRHLRAFARSRKRQRLADGALELASNAVKFRTNRAAGGRPAGADEFVVSSVEEYPYFETMSTVEEMMLLGNVAAAETLYKRFSAAALLRAHAPPRAHALDLLNEMLAEHGMSLDTKDNASLAKSLKYLEGQFPASTVKTIKMAVTRSMSQAKYAVGCAEDAAYHYGLALALYTHFTSPIRRYSDILVHRQLQLAIEAAVYDEMAAQGLDMDAGLDRCLGTGRAPALTKATAEDCLNVSVLRSVTANLNERTALQQWVGRYSSASTVALLFRQQGASTEHGVVVRQGKSSVNVSIARIGLDVVVPVQDPTKHKLFEEVRVHVGFDWEFRAGLRLVAKMADRPIQEYPEFKFPEGRQRLEAQAAGNECVIVENADDI